MINDKFTFYIERPNIEEVKGEEPGSGLKFDRTKLPDLINKRHSHNSFVLKNYLFIVFGKNNDQKIADKIECLDLKDPNALFFEIAIDGDEKYFQNPMLFEAKDEPEEKDLSRMYFFGGRQENIKRSLTATKETPLFELLIHWDQGMPMKGEIKIVLSRDDNMKIMFAENPIFK